MSDLLPVLAAATLCPDCEVAPGRVHRPDCEVAVCTATGLQRLLHRTPPDDLIQLLFPALPDGHDCGADRWTGEPHGVAECRQLGLFVRRDDGRWVPCPADWPGATADLTRLFHTAAWSPAEQRWRRAAR